MTRLFSLFQLAKIYFDWQEPFNERGVNMINRTGILILSTCSLLFLGACENNPKTAMGGLVGGGALVDKEPEEKGYEI